VLDGIASLLDKSLLRRETTAAGEPRLGMLETIREYGLERLADSGESDRARRQHAAYFLALAEQAEPELWGAEQTECLDRLETEHDNLRAALDWYQADPGGAEGGVRLAGAIWRFWSVRGYLTEGQSRLAAVLSRAAPGMPSRSHRAARAKALDGAGYLAMNLGSYDRARALFKESLAIGRELGDKRIIATALNSLGDAMRWLGDEAPRPLYEEALATGREVDDRRSIAYSLTALGIVACGQGDYQMARSLFEEGLVIKRQLNDRRSIAYSLGYLAGMAQEQGDFPESRSLHQQSLAIWRELGDRRGIAGALGSLGHLARTQRDFETARSLCEEGLAIRRTLGNPREILMALGDLAEVAHEQGNGEAERTFLQESLTIGRALDDTHRIGECLERWARLASTQGEAERAARLRGAAAALRGSLGDQPTGDAPHDDEPEGELVRSGLGGAAFAAAWAAGQALPLEDAIAYALETPTASPGNSE
jgi:tetratricopeptide (TPR) repeat protein